MFVIDMASKDAQTAVMTCLRDIGAEVQGMPPLSNPVLRPDSLNSSPQPANGMNPTMTGVNAMSGRVEASPNRFGEPHTPHTSHMSSLRPVDTPTQEFTNSELWKPVDTPGRRPESPLPYSPMANNAAPGQPSNTLSYQVSQSSLSTPHPISGAHALHSPGQRLNSPGIGATGSGSSGVHGANPNAVAGSASIMDPGKSMRHPSMMTGSSSSLTPQRPSSALESEMSKETAYYSPGNLPLSQNASQVISPPWDASQSNISLSQPKRDPSRFQIESIVQQPNGTSENYTNSTTNVDTSVQHAPYQTGLNQAQNTPIVHQTGQNAQNSIPTHIAPSISPAQTTALLGNEARMHSGGNQYSTSTPSLGIGEAGVLSQALMDPNILKKLASEIAGMISSQSAEATKSAAPAAGNIRTNQHVVGNIFVHSETKDDGDDEAKNPATIASDGENIDAAVASSSSENKKQGRQREDMDDTSDASSVDSLAMSDRDDSDSQFSPCSILDTPDCSDVLIHNTRNASKGKGKSESKVKSKVTAGSKRKAIAHMSKVQNPMCPIDVSAEVQAEHEKSNVDQKTLPGGSQTSHASDSTIDPLRSAYIAQLEHYLSVQKQAILPTQQPISQTPSSAISTTKALPSIPQTVYPLPSLYPPFPFPFPLQTTAYPFVSMGPTAYPNSPAPFTTPPPPIPSLAHPYGITNANQCFACKETGVPVFLALNSHFDTPSERGVSIQGGSTNRHRGPEKVRKLREHIEIERRTGRLYERMMDCMGADNSQAGNPVYELSKELTQALKEEKNRESKEKNGNGTIGIVMNNTYCASCLRDGLEFKRRKRVRISDILDMFSDAVADVAKALHFDDVICAVEAEKAKSKDGSGTVDTEREGLRSITCGGTNRKVATMYNAQTRNHTIEATSEAGASSPLTKQNMNEICEETVQPKYSTTLNPNQEHSGNPKPNMVEESVRTAANSDLPPEGMLENLVASTNHSTSSPSEQNQADHQDNNEKDDEVDPLASLTEEEREKIAPFLFSTPSPHLSNTTVTPSSHPSQSVAPSPAKASVTSKVRKCNSQAWSDSQHSDSESAMSSSQTMRIRTRSRGMALGQSKEDIAAALALAHAFGGYSIHFSQKKKKRAK